MLISIRPLLIALLTGLLAIHAGAQSRSSSGGSDRENMSNQFWWPEMLDLGPLRQHSPESSPLDRRFNYARDFRKLDLKTVKRDIEKVMKTSQDWWPADYGTYGPFFIRALRPLVLLADEPTTGKRTSFTGAQKKSFSPINATLLVENSPGLWLLSKWV